MNQLIDFVKSNQDLNHLVVQLFDKAVVFEFFYGCLFNLHLNKFILCLSSLQQLFIWLNLHHLLSNDAWLNLFKMSTQYLNLLQLCFDFIKKLLIKESFGVLVPDVEDSLNLGILGMHQRHSNKGLFNKGSKSLGEELSIGHVFLLDWS